jgi:hypothetical protein
MQKNDCLVSRYQAVTNGSSGPIADLASLYDCEMNSGHLTQLG